MNDSQSPSCSFSSADSTSPASGLENAGRSLRSAGGGGVSFSPGVMLQGSRRWRDVFWLIIFVLHLMGAGLVLVVLGLNRFRITDRLNIDRYTMRAVDAHGGLTEDYWPLYAVAGGVGTFLGWIWLLLLGSRANQIMKFAVHILTTYLAVVSVLCFWDEQFFWGVVFAVGSGLQFLYVISAIDRLPFTMLVLRGAVKMVWSLPEVIKISCAFMLVMLLWLGLWSFGVSGVVAAGFGDGGSWWLLLAFSVSLFWTAAVLCNTLHVVVSGMVFLVLIHGGREAPSMPSKPLLKSIHYATTTSFGSICYGSLFTASIRTLRWEIRGLRSKIGNNECLLCCVDFLFHLVETLVRFFNKYAYVQHIKKNMPIAYSHLLPLHHYKKRAKPHFKKDNKTVFEVRERNSEARRTTLEEQQHTSRSSKPERGTPKQRRSTLKQVEDLKNIKNSLSSLQPSKEHQVKFKIKRQALESSGLQHNTAFDPPQAVQAAYQAFYNKIQLRSAISFSSRKSSVFQHTTAFDPPQASQAAYQAFYNKIQLRSATSCSSCESSVP